MKTGNFPQTVVPKYKSIRSGTHLILFSFITILLVMGCNLSDKKQINNNTTNLDTLCLLTTDSLNQHFTDSLSKAIFFNELGCSLAKKENMIEALELYDKALLLLSNENSEPALVERGKVLVNKGAVFQQYDDYETAYALYLEAENLFLSMNTYNRLINLYGRMGNIFLQNSSLENYKQIMQKENEIIDKITDLEVMVDYYIHQGNVFYYDEDYESGNELFNKALDILNQTQNLSQLHTLYYNKGFYARVQGLLEESEIYYRKALALAEKTEIQLDICDGILGVGKILYYRKKFNEAETYILTALEMAEKIQSKLLTRNCYIFLSCLEYERGNYKKAFEYQEMSYEYELELASAETQNKLNFMAVQYDLARKETNIKDLEHKNIIYQYQVKQRNGLLTGISILTLILIVLIFFYRRYSKRKRLLSETRIKQLEQEKQLVATQSVLDGETRERARLARDLHDGLGGMLTGVRLNLQEMKNGAKLEFADVERFDKALVLLDESVREMRRVSHHLMPDSLNRFGLKSAVSDFCQSVSSNVSFDYFGEFTRLDQQLEVMIYRTIQELVNNALKHSGADQIMVQIMQEAHRIAFTVEDNGCGFDTETETKGAGLQNIRTRVAAHNGTLFVDSKIDVGTEVNVELRIKICYD